jgi:hypothetical protein
MYYFPKQVRHTSALNPNNTLLIRKGVDSGRQAEIEEGDRSACEQCITFLNKSGIHLRSIRVTHCLFVKALIQEGRQKSKKEIGRRVSNVLLS